MKCLTQEQLELLARGEIGDDVALAWQDHIGQCPTCRELLEQLKAGENLLCDLKHDLGSDIKDILCSTMADAATVSDNQLQCGDRIGSYTLGKVLGQGGMGVVYIAEQENPRRKVALKLIRSGTVSTELVRRFKYEAEILGRLQHPGIAQIYEAGTIRGPRGSQPYFAMELIQGVPLNHYLAENSLSTRERLELLATICDAVHHAHQKGIIHRDLKPGNILVTETGQPKILDFGVARATDSDIQTTTIQTDIGQLIGTVPYMSPEQVAGDPAELDTRSDVYALGVIAYEVLSGRPPYDLRNKIIPEAVRIIRENTPPPLSGTNRTFRGDVETIVSKALEKDKSRRYQSASDFASDIRHYLAYEPIEAKRDSTWYVISKLARRHKYATAAIVCLLVTIFSSTFVSYDYYREAKRALNERRQGQLVLQDWEKEREELLRGTHPALKYKALSAFLVAYWPNGLEVAQNKFGLPRPSLSVENTVILFLLDENYAFDQLLSDLSPNHAALAYYANGERHLKAGRIKDAITAFTTATTQAGDRWSRLVSQERLNELRSNNNRQTATQPDGRKGRDASYTAQNRH